MSSTTVIVEQDKLSQHIYVEDHNAIEDQRTEVKSNKVKVLRFKMYRKIIEIIKSVLLVITFLVIYKVTGFHSWWIQLVGNIT